MFSDDNSDDYDMEVKWTGSGTRPEQRSSVHDPSFLNTFASLQSMAANILHFPKLITEHLNRGAINNQLIITKENGPVMSSVRRTNNFKFSMIL